MKILTPVDHSQRDSVVLPYCVRMAKGLDAGIVIVHVVALTRTFFPRAMREAEAYVTAVEAGLQEQGASVESMVDRGNPAPVISSLAEEMDVDMIIMTTRGRGRFGKLVVGSVADAVLANCRKPVLLLSEAANGGQASETRRMQAAYLASIVWQREARGLTTKTDSERELERLARAGLDPGVLFDTYKAQQARDPSAPVMDIRFQLDTLRAFLPEALPDDDEDALRNVRTA